MSLTNSDGNRTIILIISFFENPSIVKQLNSFTFQVVAAIDGRLSVPKAFDQAQFERRYGRPVRGGEAGCALSHQQAALTLLQTDCKWGLVLEDDAIISGGIDEAITAITSLKVVAPTAVILGYSKLRKQDLWWFNLKYGFSKDLNIQGYELGTRGKVNFYGTVGYLINSPAAKIISERSSVGSLADDWSSIQSLGIKILQVRDPLVYEDLSTDSSTGNSFKPINRLTFRTFFSELCALIHFRR